MQLLVIEIQDHEAGFIVQSYEIQNSSIKTVLYPEMKNDHTIESVSYDKANEEFQKILSRINPLDFMQFDESKDRKVFIPRHNFINISEGSL